MRRTRGDDGEEGATTTGDSNTNSNDNNDDDHRKAQLRDHHHRTCNVHILGELAERVDGVSTRKDGHVCALDHAGDVGNDEVQEVDEQRPQHHEGVQHLPRRYGC